MKNMRKLEGIVKDALEESKEARDDDFLLIFNVYKAINESVIYKDFRQVMRDHVEFRLPSFESITRARRKIQKEYPELVSSRKTKEVRKAEEKVFYNYATDKFHEYDEGFLETW